jgi:hypothetical protein
MLQLATGATAWPSWQVFVYKLELRFIIPWGKLQSESSTTTTPAPVGFRVLTS